MKTCKTCGANLTHMEGTYIWTCDRCHTNWSYAPKPSGYWTAGGEDWWTQSEAEDGYAPVLAYFVPFPEED